MKKSLSLPLNSFGIHTGPPNVPPYWFDRVTGCFWLAAFRKKGLAESAEVWLNSYKDP